MKKWINKMKMARFFVRVKSGLHLRFEFNIINHPPLNWQEAKVDSEVVESNANTDGEAS